MANAIPPQYLRASQSPHPRTLVDILLSTTQEHPQALALDDGNQALTYSELLSEIASVAMDLHRAGVRTGDRVGIRLPSGNNSLYISILATLFAGAAYVPVDFDDPDERASLVFSEADITASITVDGITQLSSRTTADNTDRPQPPQLHNDAWIIFTSGSTGKPKGVAATHRNAAAFVDAESQLFLQQQPLGPQDRVMAGLSVAFDASCEEMWLAWAHGACLVPAPRSLVKSGSDLAPWLVDNSITVISTVPTLAALWPDEALSDVRLLIFGGEACPPELVTRLAIPGRELWNTYGPTEATVVSSAAQMHKDQPVSIGLPLNGWNLAVVDHHGHPVSYGDVGELIIGGVGLAHYLDPAKDKEKYAPMPSLGLDSWSRAYRSGDHVRLERDGLYFVGRIDDQVKIGGRRIELGEINTALSALDGIRTAAIVVQTTGSGNKVLVGYIAPEDSPDNFDLTHATEQLQQTLPAALVPRLAVLPELPVTTSGKVDKKALPWPLSSSDNSAGGASDSQPQLTSTQSWLAELWSDSLGITPSTPEDDFYELGGTSLGAARLVSRIREAHPWMTVAEFYSNTTLGQLAAFIDEKKSDEHESERPYRSEIYIAKEPEAPRPISWKTRLAQTLLQIPLMALHSGKWLAWVLIINLLLKNYGAFSDFALTIPLHIVLIISVLFLTPLGQMPLAVILIRLITWGITPGSYPRGGQVHVRIWIAERINHVSGALSVAGSAWITFYARALGAELGKGVQLHSIPPVTGLLRAGKYSAIAQEVDIRGWWVSSHHIHIGTISVGSHSTIGARCTLFPSVKIGKNVTLQAGSSVVSGQKLTAHTTWSGSPAHQIKTPKNNPFPTQPAAGRPLWAAGYAGASAVVALIPLLSIAVGILFITYFSHSFVQALALSPLMGLISFAVYSLLVLLVVRLCSRKLTPGVSAVRSMNGLRIWTVQRIMDNARMHLFPLYASQLTPVWLRMLGAQIGKNTEISTAIMLPSLTTVKDGAFLADDTLVGGYELGTGGWMYVAPTTVGKRSFLGNSGIAAPATELKKDSLVAVLSAVPRKTQSGSNWIGSPPEKLRRNATTAESSTTYTPTKTLKKRRGFIELLRLLAPMVSALLCVSTLSGMHCLVATIHPWSLHVFPSVLLTLLGAGILLMIMGALAAEVTILMKWLCVGQIKPGEHVLWSRFVWLNELQDQFVESVAGPWFLQHVLGDGSLNIFLRGLGVTVGKGAWIESYWFPEADLCTVEQAATVGYGCVVQTHLFQDRVMSVAEVHLGESSCLGAHSVILPGAALGEHSTVEPGSLVLRGDHIPKNTRWQGNPVELV